MGQYADLQISKDLNFQEREWIFERVGYLLLSVFVVLALTGLFGKGPLSITTVDGGGAFSITYQRFAHYQSETEFSMQFRGAAIKDGEVTMWLSEKFLDGVELKSIQPEPDQVKGSEGGTAYVFPVDSLGEHLEVALLIQPETIGGHGGDIGLKDGPRILVKQFFYP